MPCFVLPGLCGEAVYFLHPEQTQGPQVPATLVAWCVCLSGLSSHALIHQNDPAPELEGGQPELPFISHQRQAHAAFSNSSILVFSFLPFIYLSIYLYVYLLLVLKTKIVPLLVHLMCEDCYEEP